MASFAAANTSNIADEHQDLLGFWVKPLNGQSCLQLQNYLVSTENWDRILEADGCQEVFEETCQKADEVCYDTPDFCHGKLVNDGSTMMFMLIGQKHLLNSRGTLSTRTKSSVRRTRPTRQRSR